MDHSIVVQGLEQILRHMGYAERDKHRSLHVWQRLKRSSARFWQLFWSGGEAEEPLVEVVRAAAVDPQIKDSLFMILRMEPKQRQAAVQSLVIRLKNQGAPGGLIAALGYLEDDEFADATLKVLENNV